MNQTRIQARQNGAAMLLDIVTKISKLNVCLRSLGDNKRAELADEEKLLLQD